MGKQIPIDFSVDFIDEVKPLTSTLSLARCRIFYKGLNRNGSYITDEFAEKLVQTLPYAPVKGIYDGETADYGGHRYDSPRGQVYGVVPGEDKINFAWEKHLDNDGVEREYATCNILLYTAIFDEAKKIPEKSQSMELYPPSIKGDWSTDFSGQEAFVFEEGSFLGLQVLGDDVEPCFEGAGFYALQDLKEQFSLILDEIKKSEQYINKESDEQMQVKHSVAEQYSAAYDALWTNLNTNFNEEKEFTVDYNICEINDAAALVFNISDQTYSWVKYEKTEDETYSFSEGEPVTFTELTDDLVSLKESNEGTFSGLAEKFANMEVKISECENTITTLSTEKETFEQQIAEKDSQFSELQAEVEQLREFKAATDKAEKEAIVRKYEKKLSEEQVNDFKEKLDNYTATELEKDLAFAFVKSNIDLFEEKDEDDGLEFKNQDSNWAAILNQYENGGHGNG